MRTSQQLLFRLTQAVETVKKSTGGKAWQKPWGFSGFTKTQTRNRQKQIRDEQGVQAALREAAAGEAAAGRGAAGEAAAAAAPRAP